MERSTANTCLDFGKREEGKGGVLEGGRGITSFEGGGIRIACGQDNHRDSILQEFMQTGSLNPSLNKSSHIGQKKHFTKGSVYVK